MEDRDCPTESEVNVDRVNLNDPEKLDELLARITPEGHITVARLDPPTEPDGRPSERTIGRIPGDHDDAAATLHRLLLVDGADDEKVELRLRAYKDKEKLGEAKVIARLTRSLPSPPVEQEPATRFDVAEEPTRLRAVAPPTVASDLVAVQPSPMPAGGESGEIRLLRLELLDLRTEIRSLRSEVVEVRDHQRRGDDRLNREERHRSDSDVRIEDDFDRFCAEIELKVDKTAGALVSLAERVETLDRDGARIVEDFIARFEGNENQIGELEASANETAKVIDLLVDRAR